MFWVTNTESVQTYHLRSSLFLMVILALEVVEYGLVDIS